MKVVDNGGYKGIEIGTDKILLTRLFFFLQMTLSSLVNGRWKMS